MNTFIAVVLVGSAPMACEGDFSLPMRIHDQPPPGVDVMTARKAAIRYSYADTDQGGMITIVTPAMRRAARSRARRS